MCCEAQFDLVVPNVDVRMMIHSFGQFCHSTEEADALHEVLEDKEFRDSFSSQTPAFEHGDLSLDLFAR